ncbi:membrane protein [Halomonas halocynthiae]|uniref:outer membrane lipoprotein n=1 Tax=Halomonas halocynthiae TaxID=176290 RepID=UPI0004050CCF|nr:membrane protein [Halomonas halocynthiae]
MKRLIPIIAVSALSLAGCANTAPFSGNVYSANQAGTAQNVTLGTITALRQVQIQADSRAGGLVGTVGGGAIGGILGSGIGGGSGRQIATVVGAMGGAAAGSAAEERLNRITAWEIEVRKENGQSIIVVQKADQPFQVGQRVRIVGNGNNASVVPF